MRRGRGPLMTLALKTPGTSYQMSIMSYDVTSGGA
jgi:hypothetical protein